MAPPRRRRRADILDPVIPPGPSQIDLHTHTLRSDGLLAPAVLARAAFAAGVRLLAITDHDDLSAVRELVGPGRPGLPAGVELVAGVEINCVTRDIAELRDSEIHVLGLGVRADDDEFEATLAQQRGRRRERFERMIARLSELGLPVEREIERIDLAATEALGRPTVARLLIAAGHASSIDDAFARLLGRGRPAYVPREGIRPLEAIRAIRAAGGVSVLAHFSEAPERPDLVRELRDEGLGGLEVHYRTFDRPTVEAVATIAAALGLIATGGSDYHGDDGPYATAHAGLWVPPEVGTNLAAALGHARVTA